MRAQVYQKEVQEEDGVTEEAPVPRKVGEDVYEGRHQAKTVTQIRDFVGRLSSLQAEHQALRLRAPILRF